MKTIKEFKSTMFYEEKTDLHNANTNTLLGAHLNTLFNEDPSEKSTVHHLSEKIEVIVQMYKNGINVFTDEYKLGSVTKAFYQVKLSEYDEY